MEEPTKAVLGTAKAAATAGEEDDAWLPGERARERKAEAGRIVAAIAASPGGSAKWKALLSAPCDGGIRGR